MIFSPPSLTAIDIDLTSLTAIPPAVDARVRPGRRNIKATPAKAESMKGQTSSPWQGAQVPSSCG